MTTSRKTILVFTNLVIVTVLVAGFQNCSGAGTSPADFEAKSSEGGDDGEAAKPTEYLNAGDGTCSEAPKTKITLNAAGTDAEVVRENCSDIPPAVASGAASTRMDHNLSNLLHNGVVFDAPTSEPGNTLYLCRGEVSDLASNKKWVADAVIRDPATTPLLGRMAIGTYNLTTGALESKFETGYVPVATPKATGGEQKYIHQPATDNPDTYQLRVRLSDLAGWVSYTPGDAGIVLPLDPATVTLQCHTQ